MASQEQISRAINIGIVANESDAVRALKRFESAVSSIKSPVKDLTAAMSILDDQFKQGIITDEEHSRAKAKLIVQVDAYDQRMKKLGSTYEKVRNQEQEAVRQAEALEATRRRQEQQTARLAKAERDRANGLREQKRIIDDLAMAERQREERMSRLTNMRKDRTKRTDADSKFNSRLSSNFTSDALWDGYSDTALQHEANTKEMIAEMEATKAANRVKEENARATERQARAERDRANGLREQARIQGDLATAEANRARREEEAHRRREARAAAIERRKQKMATESSYREDQRLAPIYAEAMAAYEADMLAGEGRSFMGQFETKDEARARRVGQADDLHSRGAINAAQHARAVADINKQYSAMNAVMGQAKGVVGTLFGPLTIALATGEGLRRAIGLAAEYESTRARMSVLTGSQAGADSLLMNLRGLTGQVPVTFSSSHKAASTLLQYGVGAGQVPGVVKQLAAITGGNSDNFERLSLAYSQSAGMGRLQGQELLQMINAGFNPLRAISAKTGESLLALKKRMEEGALGFEEVAEAYATFTSETGKFGGMLEEQANTLGGKLTKLRSEFEKLGTAVGEALSPLIKQLSDRASGKMGAITEMLDAAQNGTRKGTSGFSQISRAARTLPDYMIPDFVGEIDQMIRDDKVNPNASKGARTFFEELKRQDRSAKLVDDAGYKSEMARRDKDVANAANEEERLSANVNFVERTGQGFLDEKSRAEYEANKARLLAIPGENSRNARIEDAFKTTIGHSRGRMYDSTYGIYGDAVTALREQSAGDERKTIDGLLASRAPMADVRAAANPVAQGKFDEATELARRKAGIDEQTKAEKAWTDAVDERKQKIESSYRDELTSLRQTLQYKRDLVTVGKEEADIRKTMEENGWGRGRAEQIVGLRNRLDMADETFGNAMVPTAIQAGSAEAAAKMAQYQSGAIAEQIRLTRDMVKTLTEQLDQSRQQTEFLRNLETM